MMNESCINGGSHKLNPNLHVVWAGQL